MNPAPPVRSTCMKPAFEAWTIAGVYAMKARPSNARRMASKPQPVRKAVLPVAGMGTRFLPATKAVPKEMLPVVDKPVVQYAVEEAREAGIEQFVFITGRGKHVIAD